MAARAVETLNAVGALPAHIAGSFQDLTSCQQSQAGDYFIFDRRAHAVYTAAATLDSARKLIEIGAEPGRVIDPSAFDLAADGSFIVADAPGGRARVQVFLPSGSTVSGFFLPGRALSRVVFRNLVLSGIGAVQYTGRGVVLSQPELGALVAEYANDGRAMRTFGELRRTGHEDDTNVHLALNSGLVVLNPAGGFYFVFLAGVPQFRKYDAQGRFLFERHVEGPELDPFIQALPTTWKRQQVDGAEMPLVLPSIFAAAADAAGSLWISTAVGTTYVYDPDGDKRRVVQFRAASGMISPTSMSFAPGGRLLVTPGCYAFAAR